MLVYNKQTGAVTEQPPRYPHEHETVWVHLHQADPATIQSVLGDLFHCHPLVVEDCIKLNQRPKLELYKDHASITFYAVRNRSFTPIEVAIVTGGRFVITVTKEELPLIRKLNEECLHTEDRMRHPGQLLHRLLDLIVDDYFELTNAMENQVDRMERNLFRNPYIRISKEVFHLKRTIHRLRRIVSEEKTVVSALGLPSFPYTRQEAEVYFVDIADHLSRTVDSLDMFREGLSGLLELQMSMKSDRMNEIMKTLTIISSIFLPLTFIVGLYGMNFKHMPELDWDFGYLYVWIVLIVVSVLMWLIFKWKKWI